MADAAAPSPAIGFMMAAGAVNSAVGAYYSAKSQQAQQQYQAAIGQVNASLAESDATLLDLNSSISESQGRLTLMAGQREEQSVRLRTAQLKGTQRASLAASGVDLGEGSAARVLATTDYMGEVDARTVQANAARSAFGYQVQANNQKFAAMSARVQGANYTAGSAFATANANTINPAASATTSLIGSAGQVATSWYMTHR
jgi:hypothetical protein